jgi:hypothetical protein
VSPQQRYITLEAQLEREASRSRVQLGYRSRLLGPVSLKLLQEQAMLAESERPASELEVVTWGQPLRSGQAVLVPPAPPVSPLMAVWVQQTLWARAWMSARPEPVLALRN